MDQTRKMYIPGLDPSVPASFYAAKIEDISSRSPESFTERLERFRREAYQRDLKRTRKMRQPNAQIIASSSDAGKDAKTIRRCECSCGLVKHEQNRLDKAKDITFSNPPASESSKALHTKKKVSSGIAGPPPPASWRKKAFDGCQFSPRLYPISEPEINALLSRRKQRRTRLPFRSTFSTASFPSLVSLCLLKVIPIPTVYRHVLRYLPPQMFERIFEMASVYQPLDTERMISLLGCDATNCECSDESSPEPIDLQPSVDESSAGDDSWESLYFPSDSPGAPSVPSGNQIRHKLSRNVSISTSAKMITSLDLSFSLVDADTLKSVLLDTRGARLRHLTTLIIAHTPNIPLNIPFPSWGLTSELPIQKLSLADKAFPEDGDINLFVEDLSLATPQLEELDMTFNHNWFSMDVLRRFKHWRTRWLLLHRIIVPDPDGSHALHDRQASETSALLSWWRKGWGEIRIEA